MKVFRKISELRNELKSYHDKKLPAGFVPTMGALHEGHLSLARRSISENAITVCSIFVNPAQFSNPADLEKYPRTEAADLLLLEKNNCAIVFIPPVEEMYPDANLIELNFGLLETTMEGTFRPGHFKGVATVVKKLFDIVNPLVAYFGEKDFQQLAVIRSLVKQLNLPVKIIDCPTVREPDGLAMSSRNVHLSDEERKKAPVIFQSLLNSRTMFEKKVNPEEIKKQVTQAIENSKLFRVEYFEIVNAVTLEKVSEYKPNMPLRACIAVLTSATRLIDNIAINNIAQN